MVVDLIAEAPAMLMAGGAAVYGSAVLWMVAREIERARWRREFGAWRALPRGRLDRITARTRCALVRGACMHGLESLEWLLLTRDRHHGWRVLQRHRVALRRRDRVAW